MKDVLSNKVYRLGFPGYLLPLLLLVLLCFSFLSGQASEAAVPDDFTTYIEGEIFSISYPATWEPALDEVASVEQRARECIIGIAGDGFLAEASYVLYTGMPTGFGHDPNVSILVEPLPQEGWSLQEYTTYKVRQLRETFPEYEEFTRLETTIGGREVVILEWQGFYACLGEGRSLQMLAVDGDIGWIISCGTVPEKFDQHRDDFYRILYSFRLQGSTEPS